LVRGQSVVEFLESGAVLTPSPEAAGTNTQNPLLLVKGDPDLIARVNYPHVEKDEIFDLPGIVSRKRQLIPYLTSLLRELA